MLAAGPPGKSCASFFSFLFFFPFFKIFLLCASFLSDGNVFRVGILNNICVICCSSLMFSNIFSAVCKVLPGY